MKITNIILLIAIGLIIIFSVQNTQPIQIRVLFWEFSVSLIILIYLLLVVGFLAGISYGGLRKLSASRSEKKKAKQDDVKNLPRNL